MTPDREKELQARITNAATLYTLECETSDALRAEIALMRATIEELRKALGECGRAGCPTAKAKARRPWERD